ncbi:MAG: Ldh family oxidoreductase, partial [Pseudomonadota bacterium]
MSSEPIKLPLHDARALVAKALTENDVSAKNAASVAKALVDAEIDGQSGHGFARVAAYAAQARSGKVDGHAEPEADADPDPDP